MVFLIPSVISIMIVMTLKFIYGLFNFTGQFILTSILMGLSAYVINTGLLF
jgi:hypothetical protein